MFDNLKRTLGLTPPAKEPERQTRIVSGGTDDNPYKRTSLFGTEADRMKTVKRWREIYKHGGPVAEGIDSYPLFCLSPGWQLVCEEGNEGLKDRVQEWMDQPHVAFDAVMWQGILDALICGTAFQEVVPNRGEGIWGVVPRDGSSFRIKYDAYGRVTGYEQVISSMPGVESVFPIDMDRMLTITLFPVPGEMYGASLIGRAEDDIMRDLDTIESVTKAIHRHGTPKQQWDIGTPEFPASEAEMKDVKKKIGEITANTDFVTSATTINMLDTSGVPNVDTYSSVTLTRLSSALGVPEEILGLGRGSTEATANVRIKAFYDKITTIQTIVARTYSRAIIDRITGVPGAVWIEFNDPNAEDEAKKATWISAMMTASGMDPFAVLPQDWIKEQFGIDVEEYPEEEVPVAIPDPFQQKLPAVQDVQ